MQRGFTLLEMLVVVTLLAAVAFIGAGTFKGVYRSTEEQMVYAEMQQIAEAIRRFKQDTGYYPKEGPFDLDSSLCAPTSGCAGETTDLPGWVGSSPELWFKSPANFYQLFRTDSPLAGAGHQLENWSAETGRGWRGPYLTGFREYVDIGSGINTGPGGNPLGGTAIRDVEGIADPFAYSSVSGGGSSVDNTLLDWSRVHRPDRSSQTEMDKWGRPYLFFADTRELVSMGLDGEYDTDDDIVLVIE
jgi:prepilin-type N-terminal cleavage/methylation domain-containing protein